MRNAISASWARPSSAGQATRSYCEQVRRRCTATSSRNSPPSGPRPHSIAARVSSSAFISKAPTRLPAISVVLLAVDLARETVLLRVDDRPLARREAAAGAEVADFGTEHRFLMLDARRFTR